MPNYVGALPKQYDPKAVEETVKEFWKKERAYETVRKSLSKGRKFYFLDGPPFPSADTPHIGTCWNKVLKDSVIRYKRSRGFHVRDQPGYDCHGLPIELAIEQKFGVKTKKEIESFGLERFVSECQRFAEMNSKSMTRIFEDLGIWMDWDNPYMTHSDSYIESSWWTLKRSWERGLFEHGRKVVHWCPRCETVLSDYEVVMEYRMLRDPSVYVKFPVKDKDGLFVLIWTTTPWTLPSNVAVMVNPTFEYVMARHNGDILILAKGRVEAVERETGKHLETLESFPGTKLDGLEYTSPLEPIVPAQANLKGGHKVVLSEQYVTLEEGTGCVHSAPGHGEEDYEVGLRYNLPVLMLVDDQGKFSAEAGKYAGKSVRNVNAEIADDLKSRGMLFYQTEIEHRSPVCWRCKTPLLIRATDQWFVRLTHLKDRLIHEMESATWIPSWAGAGQFMNWLQGLKDWVVSRQRFWGTPLPVWVCGSCGKFEVVGSKEELVARASAESPPENLHVPWVDKVSFNCKCSGEMKRVPDVFTGWFDTGAASYACLGHPKKRTQTKLWWPADFITEGRDQISGWFFALLKSAMISMNAPSFKTVLMHGFMLDDQGREMHKSAGNYVTPQEVIEKFGRDMFRYYVLQITLWEDLKFSWDALKQHSGDLATFWNTYVFAATYMNLDKFFPAKWPLKKVARALRPEDRWLLSRTHRTIKEVTEAMDEYKIHEAVRKLKTLLVEDLSHTYIRFIRRRTWSERETRDKLAAYATLYFALKSALRMLNPIVPFFTESVYQNMFRNAEARNPATAHLLEWPSFGRQWIDDTLETEMDAARSILSAAALARMSAGLKQRQPVRKLVVAANSTATRNALKTYGTLLLDQANTHSLQSVTAKSVGRLDAAVKAKRFTKADFKDGAVFIDLTLSKAEVAEGLARDAVRRMQQMRKEMDLKVDSYVHAYIVAPTDESARLLEKKSRYIAQEVRAKQLRIGTARAEGDAPYYTKTWQIGDEKYEFGLCEVSKLA